jgi:hypothetical protein
VCPARRSDEDVKAKNSAVEAAGGGTERVCANPSMCKRAETRRNIDPPTVQPPGTSLVKSAGMFASGRPARIFLILQKLIVWLRTSSPNISIVARSRPAARRCHDVSDDWSTFLPLGACPDRSDVTGALAASVGAERAGSVSVVYAALVVDNRLEASLLAALARPASDHFARMRASSTSSVSIGLVRPTTSVRGVRVT